MDKYINSPLKKTKQTSLSDFYRKSEFEERHSSNIQSPSIVSLTPSKLKAQEHDSTKFAGKIASPLGYSKANYPLIATDEYRTLDINSNMKIKIDDIFTVEPQTAFKPQKDNILIEQPVYQQNHSTKPFSSQYQHLNTLQQPKTSELMTKKFDNSYSDLDLNLSVQPQEIRIPDVKRRQKLVNQFRLHDDDRLESNFLITPENSLIRSPQKYLPIDTKHFTPLQSDKFDQRQPPTSEIIQRLRFNAQQMQTTDKKGQYLEGGQASPKKFKVQSQPFDKHLQSSPASVKQATTIKIPSPRKSPSKRSPSIHEQSPTKSVSSRKGANQQILSSDDQDASQLLSKIRQLQSQVSSLKSHKYQFAINKYRQQTRYQLQRQLEHSLKQINNQYDIRQGQLRKQAEVQSQMYGKSIEDIAKYKKTYAIILAQLKQNREKIEDEYREKVEEVKKFKERLIHDWKRQSNEEIKKILNNTHAKHSIRLPSSKEKHKDLSKEKSQTLIGKDQISPFNSTK